MPTLPAVIVTLLLPFEHLFGYPRTWRKAQLLAMGAILSPGKRTVPPWSTSWGLGSTASPSITRINAPDVAAATEPGAVAAGGRAPWFVHRAVGVRH